MGGVFAKVGEKPIPRREQRHVAGEAPAGEVDERRRYYGITPSGRRAAAVEARRLDGQLGAARAHGLLEQLSQQAVASGRHLRELTLEACASDDTLRGRPLCRSYFRALSYRSFARWQQRSRQPAEWPARVPCLGSSGVTRPSS